MSLATSSDSRAPAVPAGPPAPALRHAVAVTLAALLAYAIWRGYQNPDLLLDLAAFRLC